MFAIRHSRARSDALSGLPAFLPLLGILVLGACTPAAWDPTLKLGDPQGHMTDADRRASRSTPGTLPLMREESIALRGDGKAAAKNSVKAGTGTFVRKITPPKVDTTPGDVTLNFDGTDIREVIKVILGDLLQVNYVIDPQVTGAASLQTERPLRREHLIPTLETLLRMNNAALIETGGSYQVRPISNAVQGLVVPQLGSSQRPLPAGYGIQVIPLQYIGAEEMSKILEPLVPQGSVVRADTLRNLLVVAGSGPEMGNIVDTVRTFDVDWMSGLSVGFFTLEYAKANDVAGQLEKLLSDEGGNSFKGLFRFVPVESANSLLVVSPQERYLQQVRGWIERLDSAEAAGEASERLYVYRVRHGDAEKLAEVLSQLFGNPQQQKKSKLGGVAPGLTPASIKSQDAGADADKAPASKTRAGATAVDLGSGVSVVADVANNSLLIKAPPKDYKKILDALKQLDIPPLQVLVEATIVEITLSGSLKYGVQWQFFGGKAAARSSYSLTDASGTAGTQPGQANLGMTFPGFNYALVLDPGNIRATLSALAADNLVNVLSSPSVMVMDNQTAKMQVGKQVPVLTTQQQSTTTTSNLVNSIDYKDTGVILTVKPRVTPGGMVQMEIEQEVTAVADATSTGVDSPTFLTRKITSNVAVRSNQAVVLGGLISDERSNSKSGVPGAYDVPILGFLFGQTSRKADRTELVVVITPKVIASDQDALGVTQDFRRKVKGLEFKF
jgi:general secretion pathway protein D